MARKGTVPGEILKFCSFFFLCRPDQSGGGRARGRGPPQPNPPALIARGAPLGRGSVTIERQVNILQ